MTNEEKLEQLKVLIGAEEDEDLLLLALLSLAEDKILERLYPYDFTKESIPARFVSKQIEIAVYLYNKRGAEGQTLHSENGVSRGYESADVPPSLLRGITPYVGGLS